MSMTGIITEPEKPIEHWCTRVRTGPDGKVKEISHPKSGSAEVVQQPVEEKNDNAQRRYLLAVCRLGSGRFDGLSNDDLLDVAYLLNNTIVGFNQWKVNRFNG